MANREAKQVHVEKFNGQVDTYNNVSEWVVHEDGRLSIKTLDVIDTREGERTFATYAFAKWVRVWNDDAT